MHGFLLQFSALSDWSLRNIHISNDNGSFTFSVNVFCPLSVPDSTLYTSNKAGVLSEAGTAEPSRALEFTAGFW